MKKLCQLDTAKRIDALVWQEFAGSIRTLLDKPYVFHSFWDSRNGKITEAEWKERFAHGKRTAQQALASGNTPTLLGVAFNRIYTLRNQLLHSGATWGATWGGAVNREQLRDCSKLLGKLVPLIIELMMDHPNTLWGDACYPVVD